MKIFPILEDSLWLKSPVEKVPWPKDASKGKNFLINETFIRIDGYDWINIKAHAGRLRAITVTTGDSKKTINTPLCPGYVFAPPPTYFRDYGMRSRCMTGQELKEAEEDHYYVRNTQQKDFQPFLWVEYRHRTGDLGETNAWAHLVAFNKALDEKRQAYAKAHKNWDYEKMMNDTYNERDKNFKLGKQ